MTTITPTRVPIITSDEEAVAVARGIAAAAAEHAADRDRDHALPHDQMARIAASGLLGIAVPAAAGGADVTSATIAEVFRTLAAADPSVAQAIQGHFGLAEIARISSDETFSEFFFAEAIAGGHFGGATIERSGPHAQHQSARVTRDPDGTHRISGEKFYSTGATFARWVVLSGLLDDGTSVMLTVPRDAPGLEIVDDWAAIGQRGTASGTTRLDDVSVPRDRVWMLTPEIAKQITPAIHVVHAAIDTAIGRAALDDGIAFVRDSARSWIDADGVPVREEPMVLQEIGELATEQHAAELLLAHAAGLAERSRRSGDADDLLNARLAVAESKTYSTTVSLKIASAIFAFGGSRSIQLEHGLDRHWRNARTHTLHNPDRWIRLHLGNWAVNGIEPPTRGKV